MRGHWHSRRSHREALRDFLHNLPPLDTRMLAAAEQAVAPGAALHIVGEAWFDQAGMGGGALETAESAVRTITRIPASEAPL
jgi:hypothetical protein